MALPHPLEYCINFSNLKMAQFEKDHRSGKLQSDLEKLAGNIANLEVVNLPVEESSEPQVAQQRL